MIAKRIVGYLKTADYEVLKNKSKQFTWSGHGDEEIDGPTLRWLLLQMCNPSTRVGVAELKDDLRKATSAKFQHNVKELTDYMSSKYRNIQEKGQNHEDYILDLFNALDMVPNSDFSAHIRFERRAWEMGADKSYDEIIVKAVTLYNNAVSANRWSEKDPKDAKIMALTTRLEALIEDKMAAFTTDHKSSTYQRNQNNNQKDRLQAIAEWRMTKGAEMVERDGKTWYWCPHHVVPGKYDGLYVTHKAVDHDKWKKKRDAWRARKPDNKNKDAEERPSSENNKKLVLSNNLKAALLTRCDLTDAQADVLLRSDF